MTVRVCPTGAPGSGDPMRIVVFGASGNIGMALLGRLSGDARIDEIVGVARRRPEVAIDKVRWEAADIAVDDLAPLVAGAAAVVHLAWLIQPSRREETLWRTNVQGSARVFEAAVAAGVRSIVYTSSVGAYSPAPKDAEHDESWPTHGITTSAYSRHKAYVERLLDTLEAEHPELRVVRARPALVLQRAAGSHVRRVFLGPFVPVSLLRRGLVPVVPRTEGLRFQVVHADDVAAFLHTATMGDARGAYNLAADPVLDPDVLGRHFGARPVPVPAGVLRTATDLSWRLRLQPADPGWFDLLVNTPVLDTSKARDALGWTPTWSAEAALDDVLAGIGAGAGGGGEGVWLPQG
jgi:UDP-glucose 4-epimerase